MLSNIEYKLLIAFFGFVLVICAVRTSDWVIFAYNRSVEHARIEKERVANDEPKIQFSGCNPCTTDAYETIIPFQIILILLAFGCLILRNIGSITFSTLTLLLIAYGYFDWMRTTYEIVVGSEYYNYGNTSLKSYLLFNSSVLDFVLFFSVSALLIIQSAIIVRFAGERIYARLTRDGQTPCT